MNSTFSLEDFKLASGEGFRVKRKTGTRRWFKRGEKFLRGPVPLVWLAQAARLPGKALHVSVVIQFLAGVSHTETVALSTGLLRSFGVGRYAMSAGLAALAAAGLITFERHRGRNARVQVRN